MSVYFAYNLPKTCPDYIYPQSRERMNAVLTAVRARMEKLEEALTISGLSGETFALHAKTLFDNNFNRLEAMLPDELAQYVCLVHDWKTEAPARMEWPNAEVVVDTAFVTREEWEAIRHLSIGGSDASAVLGRSHFTSPNELYQNKRWRPKVLERDEGKQVIFDRGHYMEKRVVEAFCDMTHAEIIPETRMFRSKQYPCATANMDFVLRFPNGDLYVFEAKTTVADNYRAWDHNKVPTGYIPQTRQYPAVLADPRIKGTYIGCLFCYDYTLHGLHVGSGADVGRFVARLVPRNERVEKRQLKDENDFWHRYVLEQQEPPYIGPYKDDMRDMEQYVGPDDKTLKPVALDSSFLSPIQTWLALAEKKKTVKAEMDAIQEQMDEQALPLAAALDKATKGVLPVPESRGDVYEVSYSASLQTTVDKELLENAYPEAFAECVSVKPKARSFSIKVKKDKSKSAKA